MAINVKKLKRVTLGGEPLKEFNAGDKKPAFRQNGYGLTFDSTNSDKVNFVNSYQLASDGDYIHIKGKTPYQPSSNPFICADASNGNDGIRLLSNGDIRCTYNSGTLFTFQSMLSDENFDIKLEIINVGSQFKMTSPILTEIRTRGIDVPMYINDFFGYIIACDFELNHLEINGEQFNFSESRGTTTTGSLGTITTIETANAGGIQYLDSKVWNKKSFALGLDSANSEYLQTENISITKISDVQFKQKLDVDLSIPLLASILSFGVGGNYFFLAVNTTTNIISIDGRDDLGNSFSTSGSVINGTELIEFDGVKLYIDGIVDIDLSSFGELPFVTNSPFLLSRLAYQTSRYYTGLIHGFELQGETFDLTEGLGNQIYGSNGTIATINTSNAQGIERTNYGQWLKNGNVLKFESTNSDYLELDNDITLSGDWFLEMKVDSALESNVQAPLSYFIGGNFNTNVIQTYTQGRVLLVLSSESVNFNVNDTLPRTGLYTMRFVKTSLNIELFVNGISKGTKTIGSEDTLTIDTIGGHVTNRFYNGSIHYVDFNGEQFQFREGQGITTTGSLGTTVTINTSHADGVQYINKQVWNIDSNKYIDYE